MSSTTRLFTIFALILCFLSANVGTAGTLVFPTATETSVTYCDGSPGHDDTVVSNSSGCGTFAFFHGGQFVNYSGSTVYATAPGNANGCGQIMSIRFQQPATEVHVTLVSGETGIPGDDRFSIRMHVSDLGDGYGDPTSSDSNYPLQLGQAQTFSATGDAINQITFTTLCPSCPNFGGTAFWFTSVVATQPISPGVDLKLSRNSDGSYVANVNYTFPSVSPVDQRVVSLTLLANGDEQPITYFTRTVSDTTGTITQSLGRFDSDRTLQAVATACDGYAEAEANVSGCSKCKGPATSVGGPVRLFDGVMTYTETDPLPSTIGFEYRREYSSGALADGRFGIGWSSIFDAGATAITPDNANVVVVNEDRTRAVFHLKTTGVWQQKWPAGDVAGTLTGSAATGFTFRDSSGSIVRTFGANHRLTRIEDLRRGRAVSITYDVAGNPTHISDERGQWSCTITVANNHIVNISVDGRPDLSWTYAYSGSLLTSVTVAGASAAWRTYDYTNSRLSAIHDATGAIVERHDYDAEGRAISSYDPTGDITNIQYPASDANGIATTSVTRADNSQATYEQALSGGGIVTQKADGGCSSCGSNDATAAYDSRGNLVRLQNARGYVTRTVYDAAGRHILSTTTAMAPAGCDPATDPAHCRLSSTALAAATLNTTTASQTTSYVYADANWPARPTRITRDSVIQPGGSAVETFTYDATTGETLAHSITGSVDTAGTQETHTTTTLLYGATDTAAFNPGGAFQTAWLSLPQPAGERKSTDGPRTDATDVTTFVYYPIDATVPGAWRGHLAGIRNALGHITRFEDYDVFGHAATIVDPNGVVTRQTFDAFGRLRTTSTSGVSGCNTSVDPLCATDLITTRNYVADGGSLASEQRPAGNVTSYTYDARGRVETMSQGTATTPLERMTYTYDATSGKKNSEVVSAFQNGAWVTKKSESYTYTSDGHLSNVVHADSTRLVYAYLPDGTLSSIQDENHSVPNTTYTYDPANRLATITQKLATAAGGQIVTSYGYDTQGNLTSVTDPNSNVTTYVYDDFGRMLRQTSPVSGVTTYSYDAAGNVLTTADANGATTTRTYDTLNRVLSSTSTRTGATEAVTWTYDNATAGSFGIGRMATVTDPTGSTAYLYQRRGLLRSEAKTINGATYTTAYTYDANGNRQTMAYPSGLVATYASDFADRPYSLTAGGTTIVSAASYLPFGPLASLTLGNGTSRTMQYDLRYRVLENKLTGPSGTIADYMYAEDNVGNITQIHDAVDARYNRDFGYDDLNRLITANSGTLLWGSGSYTYDNMGNMRTSALGTWKSRTTSLAGTTPKITSVVENGTPRAVTYDAVGNEIAVGSSTFAYSPRNALISADTSSYVYDGRGLMTIATVSVLSVGVAPATVTGGGAATGTITLSAPAAADTTILLSSNNPAVASVPASVTVLAGSTTASFTVTTTPVTIGSGVTITAAFNQYSSSAVLFVVPPQLASLGVAPASVTGGSGATGTVSLTGTAASSITVNLSSNNAAASVPATVIVPAGASSATFAVTTTGTTVDTAVTLNATYNQASSTAVLHVLPPQLMSVSVSPNSILSGNSATGTVTLNVIAGSPTVVTLNGNSTSYPATGSVTIPAGSSSATFSVATNRLTFDSAVTAPITATLNGASVQTNVTVTPPALSLFSASPTTLTGGQSSTAQASVTGLVPFSGLTIPVASTDTSVKPMSDIGINMPNSSGQTQLLTAPVATSKSVVVSATRNGVTQSSAMTLQPVPITLANLTLSASSILASGSITGTLTLTDFAPAGGLDVEVHTSTSATGQVESGTQAYSAPPVVRVAAGSKTATFTITTTSTYVFGNVSATIYAHHAAATKTAAFTILVPTPAPYLNGLFCTNQPCAQVTAGTTATASVSLSGAATSRTTVSLSSSNTAVATVPKSVVINSGASGASITVTTLNVSSPSTVTITATLNNVTQKMLLKVVPASKVVVATVSANPRVVTGGTSSPVTVTLTGAAPAGGAVITLGGSRTNICTVDASVTVPAGQTSATANIATTPFIASYWRGTTITATYNGLTESSLFGMNPQVFTASGSQLHGSVQCASLVPTTCLAALPIAPESAGDASGYSLYTPEMQLLAETESSTSSNKAIAYSYLWFAGQPVASLETATNTLRWTATDHLGTPLLQTNSAGAVVWRAEYTPYGEIFTYRTGTTVHQPLRFPGQVAQDGSDLYYNVFRHYRAGWGRYTQSDPFDASPDPYAYAGDDPIDARDPLGLFSIKDMISYDTYTDVNAWLGACTGGAGECGALSAAILCNCSYNGQCWKAESRLDESGTVSFFIGDFSKLPGSRRPRDRSIDNESAAREHVGRVHLRPAEDAARRIMKKIEATKYRTEAECTAGCQVAAVKAVRAFNEKVKWTQDTENRGWRR